MSRHFCCCIPVRAGVFLFSLLSFLLGGFMSAVVWYAVHLVVTKAHGYTDVSKRSEIILIVVGSIFTLMALTSFFGFVGSITRNRRFVKSYSVMSIFLFIGSLVSSGLFLYAVYSEKGSSNMCITVDNTIDECTAHINTAGKIVVTVIASLEVLIHLYIVVVIRRYVEQLEGEADMWQGPYKLTSTDVNQGLMQTKAPYPYNDMHHAYGNV